MQLVGIHGFKRSGKDTFGGILASLMGPRTRTVAFGDVVKVIAHTLTGIPLAVFYDDRCKDLPWEDSGYIPREVMTKVNDGLRPVFGDDLFINPVKMIWRQHLFSDEPLIITDIRYENEAAWVRSEGGVIVHMRRQGCSVGAHSSEQGIKFIEGSDYLVRNDGSIEDLKCLAAAFLSWWVGPDFGP